jgi:streptomycin 6-kinase
MHQPILPMTVPEALRIYHAPKHRNRLLAMHSLTLEEQAERLTQEVLRCSRLRAWYLQDGNYELAMSEKDEGDACVELAQAARTLHEESQREPHI